MQNKIYQSFDRYKNEKDFINLIESNFSTIFHYPIEPLKQTITQYLETRSYLPDSKGLLTTRESIANYYLKYCDNSERNNLPISSNQIINIDNLFITASTSESYSLIFNSLKEVDSEILLPNPSYPLFEHLANFSNLKVNYYDLDINNDWKINIDSILKGINSKTKFLVIITPNNPTGSIPNLDEFDEIFELCQKNDIYLLIDEVFSALDFEGKYEQLLNHILIKSKSSKVKIFLMNGISKMFALPDMKLAWIQCLNLNNDELDELELYNDTYLSANYLSQYILPDLFGKSSEFQQEMIESVKSNLEYLVGLLEKDDLIKWNKNCGGIHTYMQIDNDNREVSEEYFVLKLLEEKHIFVHPGYFYDNGADSNSKLNIVISLLNSQSKFQEGCNTLVNFIHENIH